MSVENSRSHQICFLFHPLFRHLSGVFCYNKFFHFLASTTKYPRFGKRKPPSNSTTETRPSAIFRPVQQGVLATSKEVTPKLNSIRKQDKTDRNLSDFVFIKPVRKKRTKKDVEQEAQLPKKRLIFDSDSEFNSEISDTDSQTEFHLPPRKRPQRKRKRTYRCGSDFEIDDSP